MLPSSTASRPATTGSAAPGGQNHTKASSSRLERRADFALAVAFFNTLEQAAGNARALRHLLCGELALLAGAKERSPIANHLPG